MRIDRLQSRTNAMTLTVMALIPLVFVIIFNYVPMVGIIIAFKDYKPMRGMFGSKWVGLENFRFLFSSRQLTQAIRNTITIALGKIIANQVCAILFALLLKEIGSNSFRRTAQTITYVTYFISWVVLSGILIDILSIDGGLVNNILGRLGIEPVYFLGSNKTFQVTMVVTDVWKNLGYNTIIYLAAMTGIDPTLYEATAIDGANRLQQTWHVTITGISHYIVLMFILAIGNVLSAGFDQIYNLYNVTVFKTGDILDTLVFRLGIEQQQYSLSTAVGLFKAMVNLILIGSTNYLAKRYAGYRVF
jgi:putative aldouronate transport system permease protein